MQIIRMMSDNTPTSGRRRYVVTGAASGIGLTARGLLERAGHQVVGVDLRGVEVPADLATAAGRQAMVDGVRATVGDELDGVLACAGVRGQGSDPRQIIRVNYFGARATLEGLRPLLARGSAPRAAVIASIALLREPIAEVVQACLDGDEAAALEHSGSDGHAAYTSSKLAIARWVRRSSVSPEWAGEGIALNAVAPGIVNTPMADYLVGSDELRARTVRETPQPYGEVGEPEHIASLLTWLTSAENGFVTGQVIFADGGYEAVTRGAVWP